jgi:hypothetical protein
MVDQDRIQMVSDRIEILLQAGLTISSKLSAFLESSLGEVTSASLAEVITHGQDSEALSVTELLFSPDETFQIDLEPAICFGRYDDTDEERIVARLARGRRQIPFFFPAHDLKIHLMMPSHVIGSFVEKLRIKRYHNPKVMAAVMSLFDGPDAFRALVLLRNGRFNYTDCRIDVLTRLIEALGCETIGKFEVIQFVLMRLEEMSHDGDVMAFLLKRKGQWLQLAQRASQFEWELSHSNIEILFSRGLRVPSLNLRELSADIEMVDRIFRIMGNRMPGA